MDRVTAAILAGIKRAGDFCGWGRAARFGEEGGFGGVYDVAADEGARGREAAVEIHGGDDGFERFGEERGLALAAGVLLAATEAEHGTELDALGYLGEVAGADQRGAHAGEVALARCGEAAVEGLGDEHAEDSVADEFELLVVAAGVVLTVGVRLVGERAVGEGEGEERGVLEGVAEEAVLRWGGGFGGALRWMCGRTRGG